MNTYTGIRHKDGVSQVQKNASPLSPARSLAVANHSPTGFEWGYCGSGPAQLALGVLLEEFDEETALRYYQRFKWEIVANFGPSWAIDSIMIRSAIYRFQVEDSNEENG